MKTAQMHVAAVGFHQAGAGSQEVARATRTSATAAASVLRRDATHDCFCSLHRTVCHSTRKRAWRLVKPPLSATRKSPAVLHLYGYSYPLTRSASYRRPLCPIYRWVARNTNTASTSSVKSSTKALHIIRGLVTLIAYIGMLIQYTSCNEELGALDSSESQAKSDPNNYLSKSTL